MREIAKPGDAKRGIGALLTPDNCALMLIDHQPYQFATMGSHDAQTIVNNVVGLAKTARAFDVPTLLTTVTQDRGGALIKPLQEVFPDQAPIDRTWINAWEDTRVVDWVKQTGRRKVVMAALWTEVCLAMPAIQAAGEGYDVYIVTDASGGVSAEAHAMAVQRMIHASATPITWIAFAGELQRDWARTASVQKLAESLIQHGGNTGVAFLWEQQLLSAKSKSSLASEQLR